MNINEYKLDVEYDKKSGLLYATLSVPSIPRARGIKVYTLDDILVMLEKQGFDLTKKDCINKTIGTVATNRFASTKGTWTFRLTSNETKPEDKPEVKVEKKQDTPPDLPKPAEKKKTRKTRTKKTTSDVLKESAKKTKR